MKLPRVSLAGLTVLVLVVAVECAALASGTHSWFRWAYSLTVAALLLAAVAARYRGSFWYGFAVVGWGYFLIGLGPWAAFIPNSPIAERKANGALLTSYWLDRVCHRLVVTPLPPDPPESAGSVGPAYLTEQRRLNTVAIGHTALTLLFALGGGMVANAFAIRGSQLGDRNRGSKPGHS